MAGIKSLNIVDGTGNPVQLQDLQNLWDAIDALTISQGNRQLPHIVSGFEHTIQLRPGFENISKFGEGILAFGGRPYYLPADTLQEDDYLYIYPESEDQRIFEDGIQRYIYTNYIIKVSNVPNESPSFGFLIGQATLANINEWKTNNVTDNTVPGSTIEDGSIEGAKLEPKSINATHIEDGGLDDPNIFGSECIPSRAFSIRSIPATALQTIPANVLYDYSAGKLQYSKFAVNVTVPVSGDVTVELASFDQMGMPFSELIESISARFVSEMGSPYNESMIILNWTFNSGFVNAPKIASVFLYSMTTSIRPYALSWNTMSATIYGSSLTQAQLAGGYTFDISILF